MDKNKAIKEWLAECPLIQSDGLFFNYLKAEDGTQAFMTLQNDRLRRDTCGGKFGYYDIAFIDLRALADLPTDENITLLSDVQGIIDWIEEQGDNGNYPQLQGCTVQNIYCLTESPNLAESMQSNGLLLAKYMFTIRMEYEQ